MKKLIGMMFMLVAALLLSACGGGSSETSGNSSGMGTAQLRIDLTTLKTGGPASPVGALASGISGTALPTITRVAVTLSRAGYDSISQDLTISNNVASGSINNLAPGYWKVVVNVYSAEGLIFTGQNDVKINAGASTNCTILFDPVDPENTVQTGGVDITVGMNKIPGFKRLNQFVSSTLHDPVAGKFYILDSSQQLIAIYNADSLDREKDIPLPAAPRSIALDPAGGAILVGYSTGKIYRINVESESFTLLADALLDIGNLVPLSSRYLLVTSGSYWGPQNSLKTIDLVTGQSISTMNYWYPLNNLVFNPAAGMVYALESGISPADIHRISVNAATGVISSVSDSRYHGDYSLGAPLRLLNGNRLITGSGNMFVSSSSSTDDVTFAGNIGSYLADITSDNALGLHYMLYSSGSIQKLLIINSSTLFTLQTVDLPASTPRMVFNTPDSIVIFVSDGIDYYAKAVRKTSLELLP